MSYHALELAEASLSAEYFQRDCGLNTTPAQSIAKPSDLCQKPLKVVTF